MNTLIPELQNSGFVSQYLLPWSINIALALAIFLIGLALAKFIRQTIKRLMGRARADDAHAELIGGVVYAMLLAVAVVAALDRLGVSTASILVVFVAAALAVGLALKDSLANFAAGVMLIFFKPFKTGDLIETAGGGGVVERIRLLDTRMRSTDNREIIVPNSRIYGGTIINLSAKDTRRIDLVIGIDYDNDIRKAKKLLEGIMAEDERILRDPPPLIAVLELSEKCVKLALRPWVNAEDYWPARFELNESIKDVFDANGIRFIRTKIVPQPSHQRKTRIA